MKHAPSFTSIQDDAELLSKDVLGRMEAETRKPEVVASGCLREESHSPCRPVGDKHAEKGVTSPILAGHPYSDNNCGTAMSQDFPKEGYVKVPRSLWKNPIWQGCREKYKKVFMTLLFTAHFRKRTVSYQNNPIELLPGQHCASMRELVDLCNDGVRFKEDRVDKNIVERAVSLFTKIGLVRHDTSHGISLFTIVYGNIFDQVETASETGPRQDRDSPPLPTYIQEEREEREEYSSSKYSIPQARGCRVLPQKKNEEFFSQREEIAFQNGFVQLTQAQLDECIKSRGSLEAVEEVVHQMLSKWQTKQYTVRNLVRTISDWRLQNSIVDGAKTNQALAEALVKMYKDCLGCNVRVWYDRAKELNGLLFEGTGAVANSVHIGFTDGKFREKVEQEIAKRRLNPEVKNENFTSRNVHTQYHGVP